jgi:hypothetical protein
VLLGCVRPGERAERPRPHRLRPPHGVAAAGTPDPAFLRRLPEYLKQAGIHRTRRSVAIGPWQLEPRPYESGPTWQDHHATRDDIGGEDRDYRRVRIYLYQRQTDDESRESVRRAAQREYRAGRGIEHPGLLVPDDLQEHDLGPALMIRQHPQAVRLDHWLVRHEKSLDLPARVGMVRQLAERSAMPTSSGSCTGRSRLARWSNPATPGLAYASVNGRRPLAGCRRRRASTESSRPATPRTTWNRPPRRSRARDVDEFLALLGQAEEGLRGSVHPADEPDPLDAQAGEELPEGYRVIRPLGSGSTARAFLVARDGQESVLKIGRSEDAARRLDDEATVLEGVHFEHVVTRFRGAFPLGRRTAIELSYAGEQSLAGLLRSDGSLVSEALQRYGDQLLDAVDFLHQRDVFHRDVKPDNIGILRERAQCAIHARRDADQERRRRDAEAAAENQWPEAGPESQAYHDHDRKERVVDLDALLDES